MTSAELEEQQEKIRRAIDGWRCRSQQIIVNLRGNSVSCARSHPIELRVEPLDRSGIQSVIRSENVDLAKFVMVLSYDCTEISRLSQHASRRIYRRLLLFGHRSSSKEIPLEGEPQKAIGQSLSLFMDLYETCIRISAVMRNLLHQMNSLCSQQDKNSRPLLSLNNLSLHSLLVSFGEGMGTLLILDEILKRNTRIKGHISQFRRMLMKIKLEIDAFDISMDDLVCLEEVVSQVEKLFDSGLFQLMIPGDFQKGSYNRKLIDAFTSWTHKGLFDLLPRIDTWKEHPSHRQRILQHISVFIFVANAFDEAPEKKLGKVIADVLRKTPIIYVECGVRFTISDLIGKYCPQLLSSWFTLRDITKDRDLSLKNYLSYLTESHSREWQTVKDSLYFWLVTFLESTHPVEDFRLQLRQIIQGILLANRLHTLTVSMIDLHELLEVPIRREKFKALCHMLVLLKVIAESFCAKRLQLILCLPHVINLIQADIEALLLPAKNHLEASKGAQKSTNKILSFLTHGSKDADSKLVDSLSLILLSIHLLRGNGSLKRRQILSVTLDVLQSIGHIDLDYIRIKKFISKLSLVTDFHVLVEDLTDGSFLYWRKEMMRDWLNMVYADDKISWLQYLLDAFCDGIRLLDPENAGKIALKSYERQLEDDVANEIIRPLCRDIENDLRLHVHSAFLKGSVSVNLTKTGVRNLSWYLQMRPLSLPFKFMDIRTLVQSWLNSNFYNYTAMAQYDWKVYLEMKQLAELKYGLVLDECSLHGSSEDSSCYGFDLFEIIKDMPSFSRNYSYDLIRQVFIEKVNEGQQKKRPSILDADHVVAAISTHGLTTVTTLTKRIIDFLSLTMHNLADILDDDIVKSLLSKERSWIREKENPKRYPFTRAEQLSATLQKVSSKDGEANFIDQIYSFVTHIGNGLGFARLLYTGSSRHAHHVSRSASNDKNPNFDKISCTSHLLSAITMEQERDKALISFEDFSFLIPTLVLHQVEIRIQSKEKLTRREHDQGNHPFPDDGFSMGIMFILKVMGLDESFKELNWFALASKHLEEAFTSLGQSRTEPPSKVFSFKLWANQASPPVSPKPNKEVEKLERYQKEMRLVEYGFNTAGTIIS